MGKEILQLVKLKTVRRILTDKNKITLYYKVDEDIIPVFEVIKEIKGRKTQFKLYSYIDVEFALRERYLKPYSNKVHDFEANSFIGDRKEIYARINFTKNVYLKFTEDDFIVGLYNKFRELIELLKPINVDKLPYDKYYKSNYNSTDGSDIKWTPELYTKCFLAILKHLTIKFQYEPDKITWWYMGYTLTTKIISFGWIGGGICYKPTTSISNKKLNLEMTKLKHSHSWIHNSILDQINVINLFHTIGEYSDYEKLVGYSDANFITDQFVELNEGNTYYPDDCWESDKEKKQFQLKGFKLFSDKPNFEDICSKLKIMFGTNIKKKLLKLGFKKIIIGYFNYLDIYDHPVNCRSVSSWRYSNPFVLDLKSGLVTYEVLRNHEKLPYADVKLKDNKLMIAKNVPSLEEYGYILDTLEIY